MTLTEAKRHLQLLLHADTELEYEPSHWLTGKPYHLVKSYHPFTMMQLEYLCGFFGSNQVVVSSGMQLGSESRPHTPPAKCWVELYVYDSETIGTE